MSVWVRPSYEWECLRALRADLDVSICLDTGKLQLHVIAPTEPWHGAMRFEKNFTSAIVHHSPKPGYKLWQVSLFDMDGTPGADLSFDLLQDAVDHLRTMGYLFLDVRDSLS